MIHGQTQIKFLATALKRANKKDLAVNGERGGGLYIMGWFKAFFPLLLTSLLGILNFLNNL